MEEIGYLMIQIFIMLLLAMVLGKIMHRIGMPDIIGYILAGIIFVNLTLYTGLGDVLDFHINEVFANDQHFLNIMGQLGLVFLLFGIGLETKLSDLMDIGKNALVTALVGILFPFIGGFVLYFAFGNDTAGAIMLGTTIFAMSTVVSVKLLELLHLTNAPIGRTVVGIAIFSDIICLILLAVNTALVTPDKGNLALDLIMILVFVALVFVFIAHTSRRRKHREDIFDKLGRDIDINHRDMFSTGIIVCLGFTAASYVVGLSGIVGAFLAGMYLAEFEETTHVREKFSTLTAFLLPFFFLSVGLRLRLDQMTINALIIGVALAAVAISTKFAGGYVGARICKINKEVSGFFGACMVARGDIAIVVATLALGMGLFNTDMYAAIIIMAIITQISATPLMKSMYSKIPKDSPYLQETPADEEA